jgi:hypothetical protein
MIEEIVAGPPNGAGVMVATLPSQPFPRRITGVSVTSTSTTQTVVTVHIDSIYSPWVDTTTTGNGDANGADGVTLAPGNTLVVRWLAASAGSQGRAAVGWERTA